MKKTNKKGFTIVELVIVIAVIAILSAILIPTFSSLVEKSNRTAALSEAKTAYTLILAEDLGEDGHYDNIATGTTTAVEAAHYTTAVVTYTTKADKSAVESFSYTHSSGYVATLDPATGAWTVAKP